MTLFEEIEQLVLVIVLFLFGWLTIAIVASYLQHNFHLYEY